MRRGSVLLETVLWSTFILIAFLVSELALSKVWRERLQQLERTRERYDGGKLWNE